MPVRMASVKGDMGDTDKYEGESEEICLRRVSCEGGGGHHHDVGHAKQGGLCEGEHVGNNQGCQHEGESEENCMREKGIL